MVVLNCWSVQLIVCVNNRTSPVLLFPESILVCVPTHHTVKTVETIITLTVHCQYSLMEMCGPKYWD